MQQFAWVSCGAATVAGVGVGLVYTGIGVWAGKYAAELRPWLLAGLPLGAALPAVSWALYAHGSHGAAVVTAGVAVAGAVFCAWAVPSVLFAIANP